MVLGSVALLVFHHNLVDKMAIMPLTCRYTEGVYGSVPETIYYLVIEAPGVVNCNNFASRRLLGRQVFVEMRFKVRLKI